MSNPKKPKRSRAKVAGGMVVAAGAAYAASKMGDPSAGVAAGWAVAAIAQNAWDRLFGWHNEFKARRHGEVFRTLIGEGGNKEAARLLAKLESEGWAREAVFATLREVNEAISEEAVTILAVLLRDYIGAGKPIDWFFRGAQGLFVGLTVEDLKQAKALLKYLASCSRSEDCNVMASVPRPPNSVRSTDDAPKVSAVVGNADSPSFAEAEPIVPDALRLFSLFKSQQLAFDSGRIPASHSMIITLETVRGLRRLVVLAESGWAT